MKSNHQYSVLLLILCISILINSGCGGTVQSTPSPTAPTVTQSPSPKPTITRTSTPDDVATANFIATASINDIVATVKPTVLASYLSPDGKWRVEVIRYNCINYPYQDYVGIIAYEQLKIVNLRDGTEKIVEDMLLNCDGLGAFGFDGLYWSPSNRYFYYSDWREGTPDGGCGNYLSLPIYRLDTLTQEIITIDGSHISPDQTKLAMWQWQKNEIVIWDLDKGEIARVRGLVPNLLNGEIAWSPDGQSLVYLQTTFDCALDYGATYVTRLDLAEMTQTLLVRYESPGFGGIGWNTSDQITLMDGEGKLWTYDLIRREIDPAQTTTTPVPPGVFALYFYPPLIVEYDTSEWKVVNYLQAQNLKTCLIGEQGPTDINGTPPAIAPIRLGNIGYSIVFWGESSQGDVSAWYIEDQSLIGYDYSPGLPILVVQANSSEWDECKVLAEKVLSTLHVP